MNRERGIAPGPHGVNTIQRAQMNTAWESLVKIGPVYSEITDFQGNRLKKIKKKVTPAKHKPIGTRFRAG